MEFEALKKSHKKEVIIGVLLLVAVGMVLFVKSTFAKYELVKNIKIAEGKINYKVPDFKTIAMYKNEGDGKDIEIETIPNKEYVINTEKSYCTTDNITKEYNKMYTDKEGNHIITGLSKNSKCYMYFDRINYLLASVKDVYEITDDFLGSDITREQIGSIKVLDKIEIPSNAKSWDVSEDQNKSIMAWYLEPNSDGLYEIYIGQNGGVKANSDSRGLFSNLTMLSTIDLKNLDTSKVTDMSGMFYHTDSLVNLNISNFDTSNVINMYEMFNNTRSLISLDLSNFDTSKVTDMGVMFYHTDSLVNLNISNFDTSNVTDMNFMFSYTNLTSVDVSSFNTSNVTSMARMFANSINLTSLDLSNFDTSNVTNMNLMFYNVSSLTDLNLSNFNTSNVTGMRTMFSLASSLTNLDLSSFDTSKVTDVYHMFNGTYSLKTLKLNKATFDSVTSHANMFLKSNVETIYVKDENVRTFIEARLKASGVTNSVVVTIA